MDLELEDEHRALRDSARGFLDRHVPLSGARDVEAASIAALWRSVGELGWLELGTGTEDDMLGVVGAVIVAAELGGHVAPIPFVEHTALVSRVLAAAGAPAQQHIWQGGLAGGAPMCTAGVVEDRCDWSLDGLLAHAREDGDCWRLTGRKTAVPFAARSGAIGVVAAAGGELGLFLVERGADGVLLERERGFDRTRESCVVVLDEVVVQDDAALVGSAVHDALALARDVAAVVTAAEGCGAANALLEMAIAHAKDRKQFGRPIGSFQALAHLLADLHVLRETSWWTVLHAAAAIDAGMERSSEAASIASAHAGPATRAIGEGALQVLGGIGFSDEHDAHLLFARVLECEQRFGNAATHERALAQPLARPRQAVAT